MTYTADAEAKIRQMMHMVGITVDVPHRVLAISIEGAVASPEAASAWQPVAPKSTGVTGGHPEEEIERLLDKIAMLWRTDYFCRSSDRAYVFWSGCGQRSTEDVDEITTLALANWRHLGHPGRLLIGVGSLASDGKGLKRSLDEAESCLSLLENGVYEEHGHVQVMKAEQAEVYQLLRLIRDDADLRAFVHQWLGPLLEYDEARGTDFVRTLEVYLDCGGSLREAAERLFLHPRGVRYRLDRILESLGVEAPTPGWKLTVHMAVKAARLIGACRSQESRTARAKASRIAERIAVSSRWSTEHGCQEEAP